MGKQREMDGNIRAGLIETGVAMKALKNILIVTLPSIVIVFLLLELIFRIAIPATDPPMGYFNEKEKIYSFSNQREEGQITIGRFAEIRSQWRINNMNWNYPIDYHFVEGKKLIAVIGDSYIEAFQVDADEKYPYLLREMLRPDYEVYAFGKSGAALSQYLHMSRYVNKHFDPEILIFNMVHNDFDECIRELYPNRDYFMQVSIDENGSITETVPRPNHAFPQYTAWKRVVYKSALFRYLDLNLNIRQWRRKIAGIDDRQFEANVQPDEIKKNQDLIYKATEYLVKVIRSENRDRRVIFIFDAPKRSIYNNMLHESNILWLHGMMDEICSKNNVEYLDLIPLMEEDYRINRRMFNYELDGHWNEYGHEFVARVLYDYLNKPGD